MSIRKSEKIKYTILALIFLGIIPLVIVNHQWLVYKLNSYKLLPQQEPVIELYFTEPSKIPATYIPGQNIQTAFTVHNATEQIQTLPYTVSVQPENGQASVISHGSIYLQPDAAKSTPITFTPTDLGPRIKLIIQLDNKPQLISFWADRR